ncbi:MAG: class III signal peptide-containing protein, partial [archaeon]
MQKRAHSPNWGQALLRGQGAIEYLLIIGAAILVVAIVTIAITSLLGQGGEQNKSAMQKQIDTLTKMQQIKLIAENKLTISYAIDPGTVKLPFKITDSNGVLIITQKQLEDAYASGEITIYKEGQEISAVQRPGSYKYLLNINGCYGNPGPSMYTEDWLLYSGATSNLAGKTAKISSVNNNSAFNRFLGKIYNIK